MDDLYAINAAKTEFREGFNLGDTSRILAIADPVCKPLLLNKSRYPKLNILIFEITISS